MKRKLNKKHSKVPVSEEVPIDMGKEKSSNDSGLTRRSNSRSPKKQTVLRQNLRSKTNRNIRVSLRSSTNKLHQNSKSLERNITRRVQTNNKKNALSASSKKNIYKSRGSKNENKSVDTKDKSKKSDKKSLKSSKLKTGKLVAEPNANVKENRNLRSRTSKSSDNVRNETKQINDTKSSNFKKKSPEQNKTSNNKELPKLRSRKFVKYAESTFESSQNEGKPDPAKKVPIYKQPLNEEKPNKRKKSDQYEFDSDSEKYKKRKRRRLSESTEYNKTIHNILQNIVNKNKEKLKKKVFTDKKVNVKRNMRKNNIKKKVESNNKIAKSPVQKRVVDDLQQVQNKQEENKRLRQLSKVTKNQLDDRKNTETQSENISQLNDKKGEIVEQGDNNDDWFDFGEDRQKSRKIQIISDIHLQPRKELNFSIGSPSIFNSGQPNANSTMVNNVLTPWRFNEINIRRNPHFLCIKNSSLPYINQEMVLDHTVVDKLENSFKTDRDQSVRKEIKTYSLKNTPIQKSITDYMGRNTENKENTQISLFDNDQFSPIKNTKEFSKRVVPVKRRILGEKNDVNESLAFSTPVKNSIILQVATASVQNRANTEFTDFDFDSTNNSVDIEHIPVRDKDDRPFRLSINLNDRKYKGKRTKQLERRSESPNPSSDDESDCNDSKSDCGEVKIFDEFPDTEDLIERANIEIPPMKKTKKQNVGAKLCKHKKRKDVRTKEEEEEAEKWAAAFNSMCEEIEQFPLEVE